MIACLLLSFAIASASPIGDLDTVSNETAILCLPNNVTDDVLQSLKSSQTIDLYTALIVEQAPFPRLAGVEDLPVHQEAAKVTARSWRSQVRPALFGVNDAILAFSYQFDAFYDPLLEFVDQLETDEGKEVFLVLLEELRTEIRQQRNATVDAGVRLRAFLHDMMQHKGIIKQDKERIEAVNTNSRNEIRDIERRIEEAEARIREYEAELHRKRNSIRYILLERPFGWIFDIDSTSGIKDTIKQVFTQKRELQERMYNTNSQVTHASSIFQNVNTLAGYLEQVVNATENLNRAWNVLENDYEKVIEAVNGVNPNAPSKTVRALKVLVKIKLRAAKTQWEALADNAKEVKRSHLVPQYTIIRRSN